jgi:hypothetical protein
MLGDLLDLLAQSVMGRHFSVFCGHFFLLEPAFAEAIGGPKRDASQAVFAR